MDSMIEVSVSIDNAEDVHGVLTIGTELIDVTMERKTEPDMKWEYVDRAGHFHAYTEDGALPTLAARTYRSGCEIHAEDDWEAEGCCEMTTAHECVICGEEVEPKVITRAPVHREYAPGRSFWRVEVPVQVERGRRVSVRVTARERIFFGVGVAREGTVEGGSDGIRFTTWIDGASPLGQRKVRPSVPA